MKKLLTPLVALALTATGFTPAQADTTTKTTAYTQGMQKLSDANTAKFFTPITNSSNPSLLTHSADNKVITNMDPILKSDLNQNIFHRVFNHDITTDEMTEITELNLDTTGINTKSLEGMQYATNLKALSIPGTKITDLTPISKLHLQNFADPAFAYAPITLDQILQGLAGSRQSLVALDLDQVHLQSYAPLTQFTNLKCLLSAGSGVSDLTPLTQLHHLEFANLAANNITDISALGTLAKNYSLTGIDLSYDKITSLEAFRGTTKLQILRVPCEGISDLSPLSQDKGMQELKIQDNKNISDISPLRDFKDITLLEIDETKVSDITPIATMTSLQGLGINYVPFNGDISCLKTLDQLQMFGAASDKISDISVMKNWPRVGQKGQLPTGIELGRNHIWDYTPIPSGASDDLIGADDETLAAKAATVKTGTHEITIKNPQLPIDRHGKAMTPVFDSGYTYNPSNNTITFHNVAPQTKKVTWKYDENEGTTSWSDEYNGTVSIPLHWS